MNEKNEKLAAAIIAKRRQLKYTQTEIGALIGVSKATYSRYEKNMFCDLPFGDLFSICKKLEIEEQFVWDNLGKSLTDLPSEDEIFMWFFRLCGFDAQMEDYGVDLFFEGCPSFETEKIAAAKKAIIDYAVYTLEKIKK